MLPRAHLVLEPQGMEALQVVRVRRVALEMLLPERRLLAEVT